MNTVGKLLSRVKQKRCSAFRYVVIVLCLTLFFIVDMQIFSVNAENNSSLSLNESVLEQIEKLDLKELDEYLRSLTGEKKGIGERILDFVKGEALDYESVLTALSSVLFDRIRGLLPSFACIIAIALLCGVLTSLKGGESMLSSVRLIGFCSSLIPIIVVISECYTSVKECIFAMQTQMQLIFPVLLTLMAASGGTITVAVCQPSVAFLSTSIVTLMTSVVMPVCLTTIAFSLANSLSDELRLGKFSAVFKSFNKWIIGIFVSVFGIFFTLQGITSVSYDGISRRAAKYAIGAGIPIVGGFLSGGFDLALAGSVLIKNSLGNIGIFMLIAVLFEPISLLISTNILFRLTAAVTAPLGDNKIADFLAETAENLNFCTAAALFTGFLYFLCILLFVCSTEVFF